MRETSRRLLQDSVMVPNPRSHYHTLPLQLSERIERNSRSQHNTPTVLLRVRHMLQLNLRRVGDVGVAGTNGCTAVHDALPETL